jgi:Protein of unknown function (DUF2637)
MSDHRPPEGHPVLRGLGLWAVAAGVVVLAAAAFVLSYPGIHAVALHAGVSRPLARIYPVIFDAMLVIACAAVLSLRGAGLLSRCYAWLSLLVLLAAAAGADTLHSVDVKLPHREAAATAAIIPWALLLIGFGLLLAMLRHARLRRAAAAARDAERARAGPPAPAPAMAALPPGTAAQADRSPDPQQRSFLELPPASDKADEADETDEAILAAPAEPLVPQPRAEEPPGADQPRETAPFHRMWSTPTPPDDGG